MRAKRRAETQLIRYMGTEKGQRYMSKGRDTVDQIHGYKEKFIETVDQIHEYKEKGRDTVDQIHE